MSLDALNGSRFQYKLNRLMTARWKWFYLNYSFQYRWRTKQWRGSGLAETLSKQPKNGEYIGLNPYVRHNFDFVFSFNSAIRIYYECDTTTTITTTMIQILKPKNRMERKSKWKFGTKNLNGKTGNNFIPNIYIFPFFSCCVCHYIIRYYQKQFIFNTEYEVLLHRTTTIQI